MAKRRKSPSKASKRVIEDLGKGSDVPRHFDPATDERNYTRIEAMVPMRDGVKLFTLIMIPKGVGRKMPIVLTRTPYSASGRASRTSSPDIAMVLPPADTALVRDGYIRVYQDVRGRFKSKGQYVMTMPPRGPFNAGKVDQVTDAWDTIDWLVDNVEGNNGRVGITGTSYDGFLTLMALLDPHPALKAAVPVNSMVDCWLGDDFYRHGTFRTVMLQYVYRQTSTTSASHNIPWGYNDHYQAVLEAGSLDRLGKRYGADRLKAWKRLIDHPAYDAYWQDQAVHKHLAKAPRRVPVLNVHSLFDQEDLYGAVLAHEAMAAKDPKAARTHLAIGPWCHGQMSGEGSALGAMRWGADTSRWFRAEVLKPFWDRHLKSDRQASEPPPVIAFDTGTRQWSRYNAWPPPKAKKPRSLYLHAAGALSFDKPGKRATPSTSYESDPAKPVPYRMRPIPAPFAPGDGGWHKWLVDDQRPFSDRTDVLVFASAPLDEPLTLAGEVTATLYAATTGTDADWVVKLIDWHPNEVPEQPELGGYQLMIAGDVLRGRYRERFEEAQPIPPGQVLPYRVIMPHVHHTLQPGHRLMVHVQSTWFPVCDRNPQTFVDNIAYAKPEDFQRAMQTIHHEPEAASFVSLPVVG